MCFAINFFTLNTIIALASTSKYLRRKVIVFKVIIRKLKEAELKFQEISPSVIFCWVYPDLEISFPNFSWLFFHSPQLFWLPWKWWSLIINNFLIMIIPLFLVIFYNLIYVTSKNSTSRFHPIISRSASLLIFDLISHPFLNKSHENH